MHKRLEVEEAGDRWLQQRAEFRAAHLLDVREREGLPFHDGEKYVIGEKRVGMAVGIVKRPGFEQAARDTGFDHVEPVPGELARELRDLARDAELLAKSDTARFEFVHYGPEMESGVLEDEESLDAWMQGELKRRMER